VNKWSTDVSGRGSRLAGVTSSHLLRPESSSLNAVGVGVPRRRSNACNCIAILRMCQSTLSLLVLNESGSPEWIVDEVCVSCMDGVSDLIQNEIDHSSEDGGSHSHKV
jgi:hypothetical protein